MQIQMSLMSLQLRMGCQSWIMNTEEELSPRNQVNSSVRSLLCRSCLLITNSYKYNTSALSILGFCPSPLQIDVSTETILLKVFASRPSMCLHRCCRSLAACEPTVLDLCFSIRSFSQFKISSGSCWNFYLTSLLKMVSPASHIWKSVSMLDLCSSYIWCLFVSWHSTSIISGVVFSESEMYRVNALQRRRWNWQYLCWKRGSLRDMEFLRSKEVYFQDNTMRHLMSSLLWARWSSIKEAGSFQKKLERNYIFLSILSTRQRDRVSKMISGRIRVGPFIFIRHSKESWMCWMAASQFRLKHCCRNDLNTRKLFWKAAKTISRLLLASLSNTLAHLTSRRRSCLRSSRIQGVGYVVLACAYARTQRCLPSGTASCEARTCRRSVGCSSNMAEQLQLRGGKLLLPHFYDCYYDKMAEETEQPGFMPRTSDPNPNPNPNIHAPSPLSHITNHPNPGFSKLLAQDHNAPQLVAFFEAYKPESDLAISQLHRSSTLKMKRYKQCVYYGQFLNGKRHTRGVMVYHNGRVYEGSWENDFKHGKGYERFSNNSKYEGNYMNGKPEGLGTYVWANGESYEGEWVNGLKHGSGMWRGARGDSYIGEWKFGKADGYGVHTWVNGDKYEGEFKACLKHGEGTEKFANGDLYVGGYVNGKPSGYGQYYWANASFFKGNFKNGLRHGNGVWKRSPGESDKYEGVYANDKKCGYGIFTWASGNVYKGNYFDDVRHGYGEMYWSDGSCYKGNWQKGIQHGEGEIMVPGEQPRKGVFESNVLVSAQGEGHILGNFQRKEDSESAKRPLSKKLNESKFRISSESDRFSSHSKGYPPPYPGKGRLVKPSTANKSQNRAGGRVFRTKMSFGSGQFEAHDQSFVSNMTNGLAPQFQTAKLSQSQVQLKEKIPHSSFYLHQITRNNKRPYSRDTTANINVDRQSKFSLVGDSISHSNHRVRRIQTGVKRGDIIEQMKQFTNQKVGEDRQPARSLKS